MPGQGCRCRVRYELSQRVVERARVEIDRGRLVDEVLDILADSLVPDAGQPVRARVGMPRLQAARRPMAEREPPVITAILSSVGGRGQIRSAAKGTLHWDWR
jgi:hypothetical protein